MSHYTVGIIIPPEELSDIHSFVEQQLAPFDEDIKVAPYVCYTLEKAKLALESEIRHFTRIIESHNEAFDVKRCQQALDELELMTPEQRYAEYLRGHTHFNAKGEPLSRYNPAGKWDWYVIGGRWNGWLHDRDCKSSKLNDNVATVEHVIARERYPFALVTPTGEWFEQGQMGWFGVVVDGKDRLDWHTEANAILRNYLDHSMVLVDAHV